MSASGLVILDKPAGLTSHDVVARARRVFGTRKVGHAGTLDPMATGVLIIGLERATRLLGHLALTDKRYSATIRLGSSTLTDDREGEVITVAGPQALATATDGRIREAALRLTGAIDQRPSAVSAIKVDGRRAYERVREGEQVDLPARPVVVSRLDIVSIDRAGDSIDVDVDVECSTGTYVRALARDLGTALGVGGHLTRLRRTRVGPFSLDDAVTMDDLADAADPAERVISMAAVAVRCVPVWRVQDDEARAVRFGQRIPWVGPASTEDAVALLDLSGEFLALATDDDGAARYLAVFA